MPSEEYTIEVAEKLDRLLDELSVESGKSKAEIIREALSKYAYISKPKYYPGTHVDYESVGNGIWKAYYGGSETSGYVAIEIDEQKRAGLRRKLHVVFVPDGTMTVPLGELIYLLDEADMLFNEVGNTDTDKDEFMKSVFTREIAKLGVSPETAEIVFGALKAGFLGETPVDGSP